MSLHPLGPLTAALACAAVLCAAPAAAQPPPPNCSSADLTGVMTGVMAATSAYLFTHPPVNDFFTGLKGRPPDERRAALETFMNANPQVQAELRGIRQPMVDFRNRCGG
ncbi:MULTISPECIES: heme-binding protein [Mycolicibacterium]|uniref:heme-binding protein n=1 Tax=Mycolicibacterium TaxID=1866885 RepID=UPI00055DC686|nr:MULTISPECIES: heme-binding protein [Mycolicibacterium]QZY47707.1 heme-binding protein [Mycolicibacterium austroafricanum]UJL31441.1 heme-binding protein [Mycolicibacterium vanbaalenii]WND58286.1 heme-binding protein [Mycolicibacterium vanbaalenii]